MNKPLLINDDCLKSFSSISANSIDLILCDLPYGMTAPTWDNIIPIDKLWIQYNRIIKDSGTIALFASQPFTTLLINSNLDNFRYCWYWIKNQGTNFFHANKMPIRKVEEIVIFGTKDSIYNPQISDNHVPTNSAKGCSNGKAYHGNNKRNYSGGNTTRMPTNVLEFKSVNNYERVHSSQKPIDLLEYIIKTYTNENDTIVDNTMGSGSTGVAALNLNRNFIGIEKNKEFFDIAKYRINNVYNNYFKLKDII